MGLSSMEKTSCNSMNIAFFFFTEWCSSGFAEENWMVYLMMSILNGHGQIMKLLLENGARVDLQEKNGYSALMIATIGGHWKVIRALLRCGAQVDLQTINGGTTLMIARQKGLN